MIETERNRALRYKISSWRQLPACLSNNSKDLSLHVADFCKGDEFQGLRITIEHKVYGTLFATVLNAVGYIISPTDVSISNENAYNLSLDAITEELAKFGFLIEFAPRNHLTGTQLQYLMTVQKLGYDKIRRMETWAAPRGQKEFTTHIVAFKTEQLGMWLNNGYSASESEFTQALLDGLAIDLTYVCCSKKLDWSWLDYVANIDDILRDNMEDDRCLYNTRGYYHEQSDR